MPFDDVGHYEAQNRTQVMINDFKVQLATAFPGLERVETPKGRTFRGDIATDHGRIRAYMKLLTVGDIAKEALCAVLARKLHLPVPQLFYVHVDRAITGQNAGNLQSIAFGLEEGSLRFFRINDEDALRREVLRWPELYRCAAFDAWIANGDRLPHNLLYEGYQSFWMIDHEEALPSYLSAKGAVGTHLLAIIKNNQSEHELYQIRDKLLKHAEQFQVIDWDEIRELLRFSELTGSEKYYEDYIHRLRNRALYIKEIFTKELGIRQSFINFDEDQKIDNNDNEEVKE